MSRLTLKYNNQQHLELLLPVDRVGMPRGHHDGVALVQLVGNAVDRDAADTVQAGDERVAAGGVRADLTSLSKEKSVTLSASFCASVRLTT